MVIFSSCVVKKRRLFLDLRGVSDQYRELELSLYQSQTPTVNTSRALRRSGIKFSNLTAEDHLLEYFDED